MAPLKPALIGLTTILLALISLGFALSVFPDLPPDGRHRLWGWFGVAFFSIGAYATFSHAFGKNRPRLILSPDGFHFNTVSERVIPWPAVSGIHTWRQRKGVLIIVRVTEDVWETAGMSQDTLGARVANKMQGVDGVAISPAGMKAGYQELMRAFQAYTQAHGGSIG